ncbi:carbohydrate-binding protein [Paenibacillus elgii]|uniref:carbohydrate-binding protein n=1 Tax=Paenibacillus elgii TaxID=189691 RepID=UPI000248DEB5|nr:carbohydrate-binding protein [Paenibacillus elgii]
MNMPFRLKGIRTNVPMWVLVFCLVLTQVGWVPEKAQAATNLAAGKPITASSSVDVYRAANANDGNPSSYWESANNAFPQWLRVDLGAVSTINQVVLRLPPAWEKRSQTLSVTGSTDDVNYSTLAASAAYSFDPAGGNAVTISIANAGARYVKLNFTANTGWPAAQVSELEVHGQTAGSEPRSAFTTIEAESYDSQSGVETESSSEGGLNLSHIDEGDYVVYKNIDFGSGASIFEARAASNTGGGTIEVRLDGLTGTLAGTCVLPGTGGWQTWITKSCGINAISGMHDLYLKFTGGSNLFNLNWVKFSNPTTPIPTRGAKMPYDIYEAEDGVIGGGAAIVGPNRNVGDLAGEASGRKAVTLNTTGSFVQFTTKADTNTMVMRFSIPDAPGGGGINSTLNIYVNGTYAKSIDLTSKYMWLYGSETSPDNSPGAGAPRHIYDEANMMFDQTIPKGSTIKLQKDPANTTTYAIDFVSLEQVSPIANPDPAKYATPANTSHQAVQDALDRVRMDPTGKLVGVYLPAGTYETGSKFQVYGKPVKVIGAGPWYTRFVAPANQTNTDIGFYAGSGSNGSTFANFAYFGNYVARIDGPGKVFGFNNVSDMTIDNVWVEHQVCMFWGQNVDRTVIKNSRIRNVFADGINFTNGSTNNLVSNVEARGTGDDSFALFNAIDAGAPDDNAGNVFENLTSLLTWRAAGLAVYGGTGNTFRNIYIADTLVYSGVTLSSLDFGYPFRGFGASPQTTIENISLVRTGGHFWGNQTFPAIWLFSASKEFRGIRIKDMDIVDPTYHGIMFQTKYNGSSPENPVTDTVFSNVTISGVRKSGDAYDAKSGFGIWANEIEGGPAVGSAVFNNLKFLNMGPGTTNIKNTTSTFKVTVNP